MQRWRNVPGSLTIECYRDQLGVPFALMPGPDKRLPDEIAAFIPSWDECEESGESTNLVLEFVSAGCDMPPDWCDDRDVIYATCGKKVLPDTLRNKLAEMFSDQIDECELDHGE